MFTFSELNGTDRLKELSGKLKSCRNELICRHLQRDPGEEMVEGWDHRFTNDALSWRLCPDQLSLSYCANPKQERFGVPLTLRPVWIQHVLRWLNEAPKLQLNWTERIQEDCGAGIIPLITQFVNFWRLYVCHSWSYTELSRFHDTCVVLTFAYIQIVKHTQLV